MPALKPMAEREYELPPTKLTQKELDWYDFQERLVTVVIVGVVVIAVGAQAVELIKEFI